VVFRPWRGFLRAGARKFFMFHETAHGLDYYREEQSLTSLCRYSETIDLLYRSNTFALQSIMTAIYFPYLLPQPRLDAITSIRLTFGLAEMKGFEFNHDFNPKRDVLLSSPAAPSAKELYGMTERTRYQLILDGCRGLPGLRHFYLVLDGAVRHVVVPTMEVTTLSTPVVGNVKKGELEKAILGPLDAFPPRVERHLVAWASVYSALWAVAVERARKKGRGDGTGVTEEVSGERPRCRRRFWRAVPARNAAASGYWITSYGG
jgi:hypothetical protein